MAVIEFEHVTKSYRLGAGRGSLREALVQAGRGLIGRKRAQSEAELFQAINDVSFRVEQGEVLGIIGHNGAGKSTTLKLLSRVTFPTTGRIHTRGRMAALIELGAGFHPDLSGRENVYLNGSIMGLKRRDIDKSLDEMVAFAELSKFIDTPVKRYSSGMYLRLAFAVAAHIKADVMLVDEVLSVGDMAFQQKCLAKMNELRANGATIVFVSHNMWSVSTFCKRVLLLRQGKIAVEGTPDDAIQAYRHYERERMLASVQAAAAEREGGEHVSIADVELLDADGAPQTEFDPDGRMTVRARFHTRAAIATPQFLVRICRADGLVCCEIGNQESGVAAEAIQGEGECRVVVGPLQLVPDHYIVEVHLVDSVQPIVYARSPGVAFKISGRLVGADHAGIFKPVSVWTIAN